MSTSRSPSPPRSPSPSPRKDDEEEPNFKAFDKIQKFLRAMKESFGAEYPQVAKYYALCKKINFDNHTAIRRQTKVFGDYCMNNKEAIKQNKLELLTNDSFIVNDKIQFNLKQVVDAAKPDATTARSILKYLQYILYCIHPDADLKNALTTTSGATGANTTAPTISGDMFKDLFSSGEGGEKSNEDKLFESLLGNMSSKYSNISDPSQAFATLQNGNMMQELQQSIGSGIESGNIDPSKLLTNAFGMFSKLKTQVDDPGLMGMMNMVEGLLNQAKTSM